MKLNLDYLDDMSKVHHSAWNSSYGSTKPWIDQMDESNEEYKFDVDETFQSAWNEIVDGFAWTKSREVSMVHGCN